MPYVATVDFTAAAIVLAALPHGEHGAIVRFLTPANGVIAGYVPGGRSRTIRPILQPGNGVALQLRARVAALPSASVELTRARTALATGRMTAATLDYLTALTVTVLDENTPTPRLYNALDAILEAMVLTTCPEIWLAGVCRFELLLLTELGFGLDLSSCAATGLAAAEADLAFVSPKSAHAVGRVAGEPYAAKLLPLPHFLVDGGAATMVDVAAGLRTTAWFLDRHVGRMAGLQPARARLVAMMPGSTS